MDFTEGIKALVLGLPTVFLILILISMVIRLFPLLLGEKQKKSVPVVEKSVPKEIIEEKEDDCEIVAVITASIAASMNTTTDQLEIISFREVNKVTRGSWTIRK